MRIICGTDLSPASGGALDVARALAALSGADAVTLVHVADPVGSPAVRGTAMQAAGTQLEDLARERTSAQPGPAVRTELLHGSPEEALLRFTESEPCDLLVIAARSTHAPIMRLGTTAARLITHAQVPVLCVRDPAPLLAWARRERPLRLLLGIDDSAVCDLGIQWTHGLRALAPVEVVLGAIYYPDDAADHYGLGAKILVDRDPEIEALLARDLLRRFVDTTGVVARPRRGLGRLGDHVVELASEEKADLVIVGTGQKTGLGRLGSVSSVVIADAPQSVVCVPPNAQLRTLVTPRVVTTLVATDLSQFANRAVPYAFSLTPADGTVHIVHVVKPDAQVDELALRDQLQLLAPVGATQAVHVHVVRGDEPAVALARSAAFHGADVMCISSHGRTGIARAIVGSVADHLLRVTRLPVLVLRPA